MRFMLLFYDDATARSEMRPEEWEQLAQAHVAYGQEVLEVRSRLVGSQVLEPTDQAVTLRFEGGEVTRAQGPAVDTKEWFAGFYLIECEDFETAVEIARQAPMPDGFGSVEVRPVMEGQVRVPRDHLEMA